MNIEEVHTLRTTLCKDEGLISILRPSIPSAIIFSVIEKFALGCIWLVPSTEWKIPTTTLYIGAHAQRSICPISENMGEDTVEEIAKDQTEETSEQEQEEVKIINLKVLAVIREAQQKHGLRHADYQRYGGYCSRKIRRLRKAMGLVQGEKRKFKIYIVLDNL